LLRAENDAEAEEECREEGFEYNVEGKRGGRGPGGRGEEGVLITAVDAMGAEGLVGTIRASVYEE